MTPAEVAAYALEFPQAVMENPFGPGLDVYKVEGKIFAILAPRATPPTVSLKCEPNLAVHLRIQHDGVTPGWHLNKKHWNTVRLDGAIPPGQIEEMIEHSYERVVAGLPKLVRLRLR
ncbi:MmcQ/YjbR family DNA-binding protein [Kutzneria sp. NPDC052558]|uniref:MmcQ/YjbR family DNA-binding protein n=1 Tax=Kutzneria sp. NPDC052558 TaxID=3364121 RepID=UPI0037C8064F